MNLHNLGFGDGMFRIICALRWVSRLNEGRGKQQFENSLKQVFQSINNLMMDTNSSTLALQGALLKFLPSTIADVISVFDSIEFRYTE